MSLALLTIALTLLAALSFGRLARRRGPAEEDLIWFDGYSADFYRPMARLLNASEFAFLKRQPGYRPAIEERLRRARLRIFQSYLRRLSRDFRRIEMVAKVKLATCPGESVPISWFLVKQGFRFRRNLAWIRCALVLNRWGAADNLDPRPLVDGIRILTAYTRQLPY
jgi:hypothetical protein